MNIRETLATRDPELLLLDGFDEAIVGVVSRCAMEPVVVYSREKCIEILERDMTNEEAEEYFDYNVSGGYVGERTPMFLELIKDL